MEHLQYPIGRFILQNNFWKEEIEGMIGIMEAYPAKYREITTGLSEIELQKQYRESSFTIKQIIHHLADTHMLNFMRTKVALTEPPKDAITINIPAWATTPDNALDIEPSLLILESIHKRWVFLLKNMTEADFDRTFFHVGRQINFDMRQSLQLYCWHIQHHYEHIKLALKN